MAKILVLENNAGDLCNFRFDLVNELLKQNYEVFFSVPQSLEDKRVKLITDVGAKHVQIHINRRGTNPFEDYKLIRNYRKTIEKINPDLILTYTIKPNIYGNYAAKKYNIPVIMNITGIGSSLATDNKINNIVKKMYKYACDKARVVFFQNKSNYNFFVSNNLVDANKIKLIPGSGVNIDKFQPMENPNRDNIIRFLFIGRIMKEKGIEEYLQVANNLTRKYSNVEFRILGPFEEEEYRDCILGIDNEKIIYQGISNDVGKEIKEVDCIVHPSYHEGMSNVLLEGAAMAKPLIASNIPGCKEIIQDGYNGFLFSPKSVEAMEEKIIKFINLSNEDKKLMGKNSREKIIAEFDRKIVVNEYMKTIDSILDIRNSV